MTAIYESRPDMARGRHVASTRVKTRETSNEYSAFLHVFGLMFHNDSAIWDDFPAMMEYSDEHPNQ
jgi:hypothetical protein